MLCIQGLVSCSKTTGQTSSRGAQTRAQRFHLEREAQSHFLLPSTPARSCDWLGSGESSASCLHFSGLHFLPVGTAQTISPAQVQQGRAEQTRVLAPSNPSATGRILLPVHRSPAHSAWPGVAVQQPSKHKLIREVQTTFPLPSKLCSHVHVWHESQDNLFPLCAWPALQATAEKLWVPLVVVCYHVRGRNNVYSHLFQFRHKQHPWALWYIPH